MSKLTQIQTILGVSPDGDWGPLSQAALNAEIRKSTAADDVKDDEPVANSDHPFIAVAKEWMGRPETSRNRFEGDKEVWADTNYPDGWENREPYCAAFQCHVVAEAIRKGAQVPARPTSPSVGEFRNWARKNGFMVKSPKPGDHFTLLPSGTSHIGLVERVAGDVIYTMEGNTDGAGSREGDGFWRKQRRIAKCDFIRIPVS